MGLGLNLPLYETVINYNHKYLKISKQNELNNISSLFNGFTILVLRG